ncbi:hypothetical protein N781_12675 [Pontibacillus halophilus JSM 076056 = DSM 19796]|uniref:Small basic protein n=1 Tax=Pontibacillus halophilus JSM 076056 = DSM 19796 TaxID=1385510 RepID=A0A0A5IBP0_9BACI|nr:small basic family protein [Pontibacillus halophilus]KGX93257.1 hypothetical protein N781_12675 [Pontibacillus halophilus JSM 076056 = DSM 19796]
MWLPILFLLVGLSLGFLSDIRVPDAYTNYLSIAVLAAFDTLLGGIRAHLEKKFDDQVFVTGFIFNVGLAALLAFLGVQIGVDLYLAAVFAFGVRLFQNIAVIRRYMIDRLQWRRQKKIK